MYTDLSKLERPTEVKFITTFAWQKKLLRSSSKRSNVSVQV